MYKYLGRMILSVCLLAGIGPLIANAQIESDATINADIPYAFVVGETMLPAGRYSIRVLDETDLNVLEIRSVDDHQAVMFQTENVQARRAPRRTELVFDKVSDQYFLSQIWLSGDNSGNQLKRSKMERELEGNGMKAKHHAVVVDYKTPKMGKKGLRSQ